LGCGRSMDRRSDAKPNIFWVDRGTTSACDVCPTTNAFRKCDAGIAVTSSSWNGPPLACRTLATLMAAAPRARARPSPVSRLLFGPSPTSPPFFTISSKVVNQLTDHPFRVLSVWAGSLAHLIAVAGGGSGGGCGSHCAARFVKRVAVVKFSSTRSRCIAACRSVTAREIGAGLSGGGQRTPVLISRRAGPHRERVGVTGGHQRLRASLDQQVSHSSYNTSHFEAGWDLLTAPLTTRC
jgi:hypothetical protein